MKKLSLLLLPFLFFASSAFASPTQKELQKGKSFLNDSAFNHSSIAYNSNRECFYIRHYGIRTKIPIRMRLIYDCGDQFDGMPRGYQFDFDGKTGYNSGKNSEGMRENWFDPNEDGWNGNELEVE